MEEKNLEKKHTVALKEKYSIGEDINKLFEAIDISSSSSSNRCIERKNHLSKRAMKRPMNHVGTSHVSAIGISKPVSMKQALRGLCISQASEMAAAKKRTSIISSSSPRTASETEAIERLYRAVVIKSSERGRSHGNDLLEISLVPERRSSSNASANVNSTSSSSSSGNMIEQRFKEMGDNSIEEIKKIKNVASEAGPSKKLLMRRSLMSKQRPRTQNFVRNKVVPRKERSVLATSSSSNKDEHEIVEHVSIQTVGVDVVTESQEKGEISQTLKGSVGEHCSACNNNSGSRPHMSKNYRWEAVNRAKKVHGSLTSKHFKLVKKIGVGDIGTVYLSELIGTGCFFALKVMDNDFLSNRNKTSRAATEKSILEILDHPFLPTLYAHFKTEKFSCLVMDYCPGGDLHVLRQKQTNKRFPEKAARFYVAEVLLALEYLHMLGVVYRDLKPENILVREDGHIMLADFDLSLICSNNSNPTIHRSTSPILTKKTTSSPCSNDPFCLHSSSLQQLPCFSPRFLSKNPNKFKPEPSNHQIIPLPQIVVEPTNARSNSFVGTHEYLAPEVVKGDGHGSSVDWWALGILLYELLYGRTPFRGSTNEETVSNVVSEDLMFPQGTTLVSWQARDLMRKLLAKESKNRLGSSKGAAEIKGHSFFEGLNWALIRRETPPSSNDVLGTSKSQGEIAFEMF